MTLVEQIRDSKQRFLVLLADRASLGATAAGLADPALVVAVVDGARCRSKADFMETIAAALGFPDYFGKNWDAMVDCLDELAWKPPHRYALLFADAEQLLADADERERRLFVEVFSEAFPDRPEPAGSQLEVVFQTPRADGVPILETLGQLGIAFQSVA